MVQELKYTKVSDLPLATTVDNPDVFIVNHNGKTCRITFENLMIIINNNVTHDLTQIEQRLTELENNASIVSNTVNEHSQTIDNIITAGFNLIGVY